MRKKILVSGWFDYPHSFSFLNLLQIREFLKSGHEVYRFDRAPLSENWHKAVGSLRSDKFHIDTFKRLKPASSFDQFDIAIDVAVPLSVLPFRASKKIGFLVTEYGIISPQYLKINESIDNLQSVVDSYDVIHTPSAWSRQCFANSQLNVEKFSIIPHGGNNFANKNMSRLTRTELCKTLQIETDNLILFSVGIPVTNKGVDVLLNAASLASKSCKVCLIYKGNDKIYGSKTSFKKLVDQLGKTNLSIRYLGETMSTSDIHHLMMASDVYISLFRAEGFNMPVAEAAYYGKKIIVTDAQPVTEYLRNSEQVSLVKSKAVIQQDQGYTLYFEPSYKHAAEIIQNHYKDLKNNMDYEPYQDHTHLTWASAAQKLIQ